MATDTATATAQPKRRRASGPRTAKPVFAVISYKDESGNLVALDKSRLSLKLERDAGKLLELVTGEGAAVSAVVKAEAPQPAQRANAAAATANA